MEAALCRSHTLTPARAGFNDIFPTLDDMQRLVKDPVAYRYEHDDGLKSHHAADDRPGARISTSPPSSTTAESVLDADVSADAGRPHHARRTSSARW